MDIIKEDDVKDNVIKLKSMFRFHKDIIEDFLFNDCQLLSFYLFKLMKINKKKCKVFVTFTDKHDFIHVLVYIKGKYVDILGIHTEEDIITNHKILYGIEEEIGFWQYNNKNFEDTMNVCMQYEHSIYWKSAEECANQIYYSEPFQELL